MEKILVIIPAYNEAENIRRVLSAIKSEFSRGDILVINDGSRDDTGPIARGMRVAVIDLPYNIGIGGAMQTGYRYASIHKYDIAVQVDGDGQHPPDQINYLIEPVIKGKADIVIGSRFLKKGGYHPSWARIAGIKLFSAVVSLITRQKITDTTSGFRAVNREVIQFFSHNYPEDYPEVEAIVLLHKAGFTLEEVPVLMKERCGGRSSITPLHALYYVVKVLLAVFVAILKKVER